LNDTVPQHLGLILDGNRRWAKASGLPVTQGHRVGADVMKRIALAAFDRGIPYLSVYLFSTENWQRASEEVSFLMSLLIKLVEREFEEIKQKNIKVVVAGSRDNMPKAVLKALDNIVASTAENTAGTLILCINYGGRQELLDATKQIIRQGTKPEDTTESLLSAHLYVPDVPDIDLLIRTSGEQRLSGYMLWRAAYAELYFTDTMWPDFTEADLDDALEDFSQRKRRFGK
jgi:undecaprenyl diphosphate synthase